MSDASTSLADHPAGKPKTIRHHGRRGGAASTGRKRRRWGADGRSGRGRWQTLLWDSTPTSVLIDEATGLIERRNWRRAIRVLAVAAATTEGDDRRDVLQRLAVASADGGQHRVSCEAVFELQEMEPRNADTWVAFANVALARGNYTHADAAARSALAQDPDHHGAWVAMTAGYAGLGWFDQARACLDRLDRRTLDDMDRWRIGRAVNRWSLAKTRWMIVAAASVLMVGILAVAVATSVPFVTREWRLREMRSSEPTREFESLAAGAWRFERRLRLGHAATVVASVAGFVAAVLLL
ncbi:MAG: tetratricopeptide repeat protein [Acidimicrobiales bacterium]